LPEDNVGNTHHFSSIIAKCAQRYYVCAEIAKYA